MDISKDVTQMSGAEKLIALVTPEQLAWLAAERERESKRLKEQLLPVPYHARRYESDPNYFNKLVESYKITCPMPFKAKVWYFFKIRYTKIMQKFTK